MYWYGGLDPADHVPLFEAAVGRLAQAVDARLAVDQAIATAGCIINTGGFESHSSGGVAVVVVVAFRVRRHF